LSAKQSGKLTWDVDEIARALKITAQEVRGYFTDGRRVSFILERRLAREVLRGHLAGSEGDAFDVVDSRGRKWEVRCISAGGVFFSPSGMVGSGRSFEEQGFLAKLAFIQGYVLCDIEAFPEIPFWIIQADVVLKWWRGGRLGTSAHISHKKALELLAEAE
jgi:hypothetical protein